MNRYFPIYHCVCLLLFGSTIGFAQIENTIENARKLPPDYVDSKLSAISLNWQIEQLDRLIGHYNRSRNDSRQKIAEISLRVSSLRKKIPQEIRGIDSEVRSRLMGKAMEKLLESKLDLVAMEATIDSLENELPKTSSLQQHQIQEFEIEIEKAKKRYELAIKELEQAMKLKRTGSTSTQQFERSKASSEIAKLELQAAKQAKTIEAERLNAEAASLISKTRIGMSPIKAKIKATEKFLLMFSDSSEVLSDIDEKLRQKNLWQRDLEMISDVLFDLNREKLELETLKQLMKSRQESLDDK